MINLKIKTYVITISKKFPSHHPRKGEPTNFYPQIIDDIKLHTIRGNYKFWKKRIDEVNAGLAMLSLREWSGKPYCSSQTELACFFRGEVGIQPINLTVGWFGKTRGILAYVKLDDFETRLIDVKELVKNDGLSLENFYGWFNKPLNDPAIIHFTNFRY